MKLHSNCISYQYWKNVSIRKIIPVLVLAWSLPGVKVNTFNSEHLKILQAERYIADAMTARNTTENKTHANFPVPYFPE